LCWFGLVEIGVIGELGWCWLKMKGRGFGDDRFVRMVFCFFNCNERELCWEWCPGFVNFVFGSFLGLASGLGIIGLRFFFLCCVGVRREHGSNFCFFFLIFLKFLLLCVCVCNHLFIGENFIWLEGKAN
jgi:hypothetical protein